MSTNLADSVDRDLAGARQVAGPPGVGKTQRLGGERCESS